MPLRAGVDKEIRDFLGHTPLHMAVKGEQKGVVELLLHVGVDWTLTTKVNQTPYDLAVRHDMGVSQGRKAIAVLIEQFVQHKRLLLLGGIMHGRLGDQSPLQLFQGFPYIYQFIIQHGVPSVKKDVKEAELL